MMQLYPYVNKMTDAILSWFIFRKEIGTYKGSNVKIHIASFTLSKLSSILEV